MKKITADWVFPVNSAPVKEGVIICDDAGKVLSVERRDQHDIATLEVFNGILVPGFVNTHCHLELSHMKGKVDTGTGLIPFITNVVTRRNAEQEVIQDAIRRGEQEMLDGGIVAVGDISNTIDTFAIKSQGRMRYHTFIELFDFLQESDRGGEKAGIQVEPEDDHEQGCQGEVQVLAEVLPQRSLLPRQRGETFLKTKLA